jgi:hypothetical protein
VVAVYKISTKLKPEKMSDERKKEISDAIRSYCAPDDIIAYLFAHLKSEKLPADDETIHTAISKLKQEYPDFFTEFVFSRGDIYPFSKQLERVLFRFQQSGVLGTINPTMKFFIFPEKSKKVVLEHISKKFNEKEKNILLEMSEKLENLLYQSTSP